MESLGSFLGDSWEIIWTFLKIIWRFVGDSFGDFSEILLWRREEVEGGAREGLARGWRGGRGTSPIYLFFGQFLKELKT